MNIRNKRYAYRTFDVAYSLRRFHIGHSHTYYLAARFFQPVYLRNGRLCIACIGIAHRLYRNGVVTAYFYLAYRNFPRFSSCYKTHKNTP